MIGYKCDCIRRAGAKQLSELIVIGDALRALATLIGVARLCVLLLASSSDRMGEVGSTVWLFGIRILSGWFGTVAYYLGYETKWPTS